MCSSRWSAIVVVVAMLGVAVVRAAIPGPNDPRYPDNIVQPRVNCEKEGSFPHPRNCSWYYRCVDRMNIGYFWTFYFECEPGTVFSDELDQCVHPHLAGPPCSDVPPTTEKPEPIQCHCVEGALKTYDVCRPVKEKIVLCEKLQCPLRTPHLMCADGYFFDMNTRQCVKPPSRTRICGADAITNITVSEQAQLPCSITNIRPYSNFISRLYCDIYALCHNGQFKGRKELCRHYYECQQFGNKWTPIRRNCPQDLLFSYVSDSCETPPTASELC